MPKPPRNPESSVADRDPPALARGMAQNGRTTDMSKEAQYRTTRDIVIPAGTMLTRAANEKGGAGFVECFVAHGRDFTSTLVVQVHPDAVASGDFVEVGE